MLKDFIDKNQDNYIGAFALQNLSNFMNPEEMESIIAQSSAFIQSRNIIRKLSQRITNLKKTAVGQPFTDFTVETEDGKKVSLSDYVGKGNYVLVDFWAAGAATVVQRPRYWQKCITNTRIKDSKYLV